VKTERDPDPVEAENQNRALSIEAKLQAIRESLRRAQTESVRQAYLDLMEAQEILQRNVEALKKERSKPKVVAPPPLAEFLVSFLAPKNSAQSFLGDLQEMYQKNAERLGEAQARRKYWIEVARSFGPLLWQWLKRVGFFTVLIDYFRSKFGL
jgi:hypothetical protein